MTKPFSPHFFGQSGSGYSVSKEKILEICFQYASLNDLSDCHEFVHDMRRVKTKYKSPNIITNIHELCHMSFGQN